MSDKDIRMPSSGYAKSKRDDAKNKLWATIDEYKAILRDSLHPDNQTPAYEKRLQTILQRLVYDANGLDNADEDPGAGIFSLLMVSFRSSLYLKNELVKARKEIKDLQLDVKRLKSSKRTSSKARK